MGKKGDSIKIEKKAYVYLYGGELLISKLKNEMHIDRTQVDLDVRS